MADDPQTQPAHRPSRRNDILDAATRLFARKGFVDASIADVAEEADVAVTAVYYHFASKEELFTEAVAEVFASISGTVAAITEDLADAPSVERLGAAIDAVWDWIDTYPDDATLLYLQLPGATRQSSAARREFEEQHAQRAFGYLDASGSGRKSAADRAREHLTIRTLIDLLMSVHTMRLLDGPLGSHRPDRLRAAVHDLAGRLVAP